MPHTLFFLRFSTGRLSYYSVSVSTQPQPHWESFPLSILIVFDDGVEGVLIAASVAVPANYQEAALILHGGTRPNPHREIVPCKRILVERR